MRLSASPSKSVAVEVAFWWVPKEHVIHLVANDPDAKTLHVAVSNDPTKANGHPALYRELTKCLRTMGAPAPEAE